MDIGPNTVWAAAERSVTAPLGRIRSELVRLLGQLSFTVRTDQLTLVEGVRGSKFAGGSRVEGKIPVAVRIRLEGVGEEATVSVQLADTWKSPSRRPIEVYQTLYREVLADIDGVLTRIDPARVFPDARYSVHADVSPSSPNAGRLTQAANRFLEADTGRTPRGWRETGDIVFHSPRAIAVLPIETVYGMVTVGALVAGRPGPMPPQLVDQVEKFTGRLEQFLQQTPQAAGRSGGQAATAWLEIEESASAVVEFLVQQSRVREEVPLRTLQVCVTCRLAKVVNPDYTKLKNRRNRVNVLSGSIGAFISPAGVSPFVLIGRLAQLNQLDPEFVCPRCQGLHAESSLITFCARCGEQCDDSALRTCGKCRFDYRSLASTRDLWQDPPPPAPAVWGPPLPGTQVMPAADPLGVDVLGSAVAPAGDWPAPEPAVWPAPETAQVASPPETAQVASPPETAVWPEPEAAQVWPASEPAQVASLPEAQTWPPPESAQTWPPPEPAYQQVAQPAAFQGWYPDPQGRHEMRWWDGFAWTEHVSTGGLTLTDRL